MGRETKSGSFCPRKLFIKQPQIFLGKKFSVLLVTSANKQESCSFHGKGDSVLAFRVMTPTTLVYRYFNNELCREEIHSSIE
jgi:hypothetical protein